MELKDVVKWCFIICCFLPLCSAQEINCTVTQHGDQTVYNISNESCVSDDELPTCVYSWSTPDNVLAHHVLQFSDGLVMTNTINSLIIHGCFGNVTLKRHCVAERVEIKAFCATNCMLHRPLEPEKVIPHDRLHWIAVAVAVPVAGFLVLGLLGFLCYKYREGICRMWGHIYKPVSVVDQKPADPEIGNT